MLDKDDIDLNLLRKYICLRDIHPREYFELRQMESDGYVELSKKIGKAAKCIITKKGEELFIIKK
jgi:hypothetical protein